MMLVCCVLLVCVLCAINSVSGQEQPLYEEDIAASNPMRVEQAQELEQYVATMRDDASQLQSVFSPDFSSP